MKKFAVISLVIVGCIAISSYTFHGLGCKKGSGDVTVENREVGDFKNISLNVAATIELSQSSETSVSVETNTNILKHIKTEVKKNTLEIDTDGCNCVSSSDGITIKVNTPNIEDISVNGSGEVVGMSPIRSSDLNLMVNGSGDIVLKDLNVDNYSANVNGSGDIKLAGSSSKTGDISVNGSGDIHTADVPTSAVVVSIAGSGDVVVKPTAAMDVSIVGSGDVAYYGSPKISKSIVGSGDLIRR